MKTTQETQDKWWKHANKHRTYKLKNETKMKRIERDGEERKARQLGY